MSSFTDELHYDKTGHFLHGRPVYKLIQPFDYYVGALNNELSHNIHVPAGFYTDLASIPWPLRLIFKPDGPWVKAAVVHDYLYKMHDFEQTHAIADAVFYEAMLVCNVNKIIAICFWFAVAMFGRVQTTPIELRWQKHLSKYVAISVPK